MTVLNQQPSKFMRTRTALGTAFHHPAMQRFNLDRLTLTAALGISPLRGQSQAMPGHQYGVRRAIDGTAAQSRPILQAVWLANGTCQVAG